MLVVCCKFFQRIFPLLLTVLVVSSSASAISAPIVSSPTHPNQEEWYSDGAATFEWEPVSGARGYSYILNSIPDTEPDTVSEGTGTSISYGSKLDGTHYLHITATDGTNWSSTSHYKIQIDKTGPLPPQNLRLAALPNGYIEIEWDAAEDAFSGVHHYKIWKKPERDFDVRYATVVADNVMETQYTDTDLNMIQGRAYFYKVGSYDNAGNPGGVSPDGYAVTASRCDLDITADVPEATNSDRLSISISSSNGNMYRAYLKIILPGDENAITLAGRKDDVGEISATYDLSEIPNGTIKILFLADDTLLGDACDMNFSVSYDTVNPTTELTKPQANEKLTGIYRLSASASDTGSAAPGMASVSFYYGDGSSWTKVADAELSGSTYIYDWNTANIDNGRYHFKVKATDKAGNFAESKTTISLENLERLRATANNALSAARAAQQAAREEKKELLENNITSSSFNNYFALADSNHELAVSLFEREQYERAKEFANAAEKLYRQAESAVSYETYQTQQYVFNKEQLAAAFQASGLVAALRPEAENLVRTNDVNRMLKVLRVTDSGQTYYLATIVASFRNADENTLTIQVIEVIPKEFAANAADITSDANHEIISQDPILKFDIGRVVKNRTATITYSKKANLTKEAADEIISSNVINKFASPPIVLGSSTAISGTSFAREFQLPGFSFEGFGSDSMLLLIGATVIVALLVIIVILLAILLFMLSGRRGQRDITLEDVLR